LEIEEAVMADVENELNDPASEVDTAV